MALGRHPRFRGLLHPQDTQVAKFLRVGVHHSNVSGYTSKAWTIRRIGLDRALEVGLRRGAESRPRQADLLGESTAAENCSCGSEKRALEYVKRAIARRRGHRYTKGCWKGYAFGPVPPDAPSSLVASCHGPLCRYCAVYRESRAARQ